jgi:hypothetical protein
MGCQPTADSPTPVQQDQWLARSGPIMGEIQGRASMSMDELIAALRNHRQPQQHRSDTQKGETRKQDSNVDRRPFAERNVEELRDRARELEIEGRSAMSKDELVAALREHAK